jgi:hypothetical protein
MDSRSGGRSQEGEDCEGVGEHCECEGVRCLGVGRGHRDEPVLYDS